jgi:hypothetical protein
VASVYNLREKVALYLEEENVEDADSIVYYRVNKIAQ